MNREDLVKAISRKLYGITRPQVEAVLEIMLELWQAELLKPGGYLYFQELGRFEIEIQHLRCTGAISIPAAQQADPLPRCYGRFTLSASLKQTIKQRKISHE